jgi:hypothetical protein
VGVPFAEATDDDAAIGDTRVEPRQQLAPAALESSLEIARAIRDLRRVHRGLGKNYQPRLEPSLTGGSLSRPGDRKQGERHGAERSASASAAT